MMSVGQCKDKLIQKQDVKNLAILIGIALAIGVYLIVTTVLISKDGVGYIERAQQLASDPIKIIKAHPPGYPFLIMAAHKCASLFTDDTSVFTWIYAAQGMTLLCRLLALIPLYLIGKLFVGGRQSFWAILILIILPYPAHMVSDVIREWPHLLFLASGLLALVCGAKNGKWRLFGIAGIFAGLGHMIRPECVQIVLYGFVWLLFRFWRPLVDFGRKRCVLATLVMATCFAGVVVPYGMVRGKLLPSKLEKLVTFDKVANDEGKHEAGQLCIAGFAGDRYLKGIGKLSDRICQHLMYFFLPPLLIGLYLRFRKGTEADSIERVIVLGLVGLYVLIMLLLYRDYGYISRRHCMPLVIFTVFYIPAGIEAMAKWWCGRTKKNTDADVRRMTFILFAVGVSICLPKLLNNKDKAGYLAAAEWISANTAADVVIAVPDRRIAFYAERSASKMQKGKSTISGGQITSQNWYHIVGSYDGKYQNLYVNGKLISSAKPGLGLLDAGRNDLAIGKPYANHKSYYKGLIKDVRIYSKALTDEDIEALCNQQIPEVEKGVLVGYWPLEGDRPDVKTMSVGGMAFDGIKDYIDLSGLGTRLNTEELTVSVRVKTEIFQRMNWILGNGERFRIGICNSKVYFWIQERAPGHKIPTEATYVVKLTNERTSELNATFDKKVEDVYSVWMNEKKKKGRVVVYKVL